MWKKGICGAARLFCMIMLLMWTYFGKNSSVVKYIGWTYVVAWYDENNRMIDSDILRINLSNKDCHLVLENSYYDEESTVGAELPE